MDLNLDFEKYLHEYSHVSRSELERYREAASSLLVFESWVRSLHERREKEKNHGKRALRPGPSIHVISVTLQSAKDTGKPFDIYGNIEVEFADSVYTGVIKHNIYKRERNFPEVIEANRSLTLNSPDYYCLPSHAFMPMFRSKINLELFDTNDDVFARETFSLDDDNIEGVYEHVTTRCIRCEKGFITLRYMTIPLAVYCRLHVMFHSRKASQKHDSVKVNGKITAHCVNTHGDNSEKSVLFEKQVEHYEKVEIDRANLKMSRYWVTVPAYSAIVVAVDLSEFETGRKIVNDSVKLEAQAGLIYGDSIFTDDFFVEVSVSWFSPSPLRPLSENYVCQPHFRSLHAHKIKPWPRPALEIFSVFVGGKELKEVDIVGSIEVLADVSEICCIFRRDEEDPLHLSKDMNLIPISEGSRAYEDFNPLDMKLNLTSVDGSLNIKGYVEYDASVLEGRFYRDKQLCSLIQGQNGFAAIHYSIFSKAVGAYVTVFMNFKMERADVYPYVYGSLISEYRFFDYFSSYNRDYYRSILFMNTEDDPVQQSIDGSIPLVRSSVVVPSYSPLIINTNLSSGSLRQMFSEIVEIEIGESRKVIETDDCILRFEVEWGEIK